jgi:hypothetical protein
MNLDFLHCPGLDLNQLTQAWCALVFRIHPGILRINGRVVLVGDGLKVAKAGRKMPGVKKLHQQSESNTKPAYIFGHSCQAIAMLTEAMASVFAVPLVCRIHEGTVFSNRDQTTLLDKMIRATWASVSMPNQVGHIQKEVVNVISLRSLNFQL